MSWHGKVRIGFTTGSAATAAAKAGLLFLLQGRMSSRVDIPCPEGHVRLVLTIDHLERIESCAGMHAARAIVRKQAGDDPDVTNGALVVACVHLTPSPETEILIHGARGVGVVTRPGLPVPVGQAAINPGPRKQIRRALQDILDCFDLRARVDVYVEVPDGERLATKTLNPRLGIVGGISILGTRGTVKPFSHAAWKETIVQCLDVARAEGLDTVVLTTGGRGQRFLENVLPRLPRIAFIQVGDHPGFAMRQATRRGMHRVVWGGFWGKLVKMAQGRPQTHARLFAVNLAALGELALDCGVGLDAARRIARANTAREALDILRETDRFAVTTRAVVSRALDHSRLWARYSVDIELILLDYDGSVVHRVAELGGSGGRRVQSLAASP
ncbi:cobalt-precorrin-5B (C(1))-methyltransferase [Desulfonatronum thioautotrophicum]|uniref:cobalt-precorrin-5B (C(1))-methyltransferase n=1 Tax=Desulfonatronum thioautotrophicum TaxID=617001 RepID=UPI0005EB2046|nr:cobalt-precorrin-5B (C(1))-methyltransferase [Desulfonatronum thioautotrophicum]